MRISYNWLKEFVDFPHPAAELADLLTRIGLNVDAVDELGGRWSGVVVGRVLTCEPVPGTEHLTLCRVDAGTGLPLPVVCGAPNVAPGQVVPVALVGAELPGGFRITERKIKGTPSRGMICSEKELGISDEAAGIMVLQSPPPATPPVPGEGQPLWKIGVPLEEYIGKRDWVFDIEVTINRPDCLSHLGVAREIAAATALPLRLPPAEPEEDDQPAAGRLSVEIRDPDRCTRYSARMLDGVAVAPSPIWMQERLRAVGVRPISNIVDVTNYVMLELGHPLHAFDRHLIADGRIIVRTAEEGEQFITLDGKEHRLSASDLLITDPRDGIAIAGVMGGLNSEIRNDTTEVVIECACFDRVSVRLTSRDRAVSSESSYRFERGVDPEMTPFAAGRSAYLMQQLAGGKVLKGVVDSYPNPWWPRKIPLRPHRVNRLLATDIPAGKMAQYLTALGCRVRSGETMEVATPSWRHDLEREIDLVEEIARLNGYENIAAAIVSSVPLTLDPDRERRRRLTQRFKRAMVELGFREAVTPTLVPAETAGWLPGEGQPVRLINPISEDMAHLRTSLCAPLLLAAARNIRAGRGDLRLFEWGDCFWMEEDKVVEKPRLAAVMVGRIRPESWNDSTRPLKLHDLKGMVEQFTRKIALDKVDYFYYDIPGILKTGGMLISRREPRQARLGWFGMIDPGVAARFDVDTPVWFFEFDGEQLLDLAGGEPWCKPLPRFPAARRDLSFVVDDDLDAARLEQVIWQNGGNLLEAVELFDLFRGRGIPEGKRSLAFHLAFRSADRTLSDAEVDAAVERVVTAAAQALKAALRAG